MKLTKANVPGVSSNFDILSPSSWIPFILGIVVLLVGIGVGSKVTKAVSSKLPGGITPGFGELNPLGIPASSVQRFGSAPKVVL